MVNDWLNDISAKPFDLEKGLQDKEFQEKKLQEREPQGSLVIGSIEVHPSPLESVAPIEAFDDPISQRDS